MPSYVLYILAFSCMVVMFDVVCGYYYKKITGKHIVGWIPFYETCLLIKLLIKIKKEKNQNADDN